MMVNSRRTSRAAAEPRHQKLSCAVPSTPATTCSSTLVHEQERRGLTVEQILAGALKYPQPHPLLLHETETCIQVPTNRKGFDSAETA